LQYYIFISSFYSKTDKYTLWDIVFFFICM